MAASSPTRSHPAPQRLLIVEDEFLIALALEEALNSAGYETVGICARFEDAVTLAGSTRPDVVLMDIRLASERDGIDAAIEIKKSFGIASVFMSGNLDAQNVARAAEAEPIGWLSKPYPMDQLLTFLARLGDRFPQAGGAGGGNDRERP